LDNQGIDRKHWLLQPKGSGRFIIEEQAGRSVGAPEEAFTISTSGNITIAETLTVNED